MTAQIALTTDCTCCGGRLHKRWDIGRGHTVCGRCRGAYCCLGISCKVKAHLTFQCHVCCVRFATMGELQQHRNRGHIPFRCDRCEETFDRLHQIFRHRKYAHILTFDGIPR